MFTAISIHSFSTQPFFGDTIDSYPMRVYSLQVSNRYRIKLTRGLSAVVITFAAARVGRVHYTRVYDKILQRKMITNFTVFSVHVRRVCPISRSRTLARHARTPPSRFEMSDTSRYILNIENRVVYDIKRNIIARVIHVELHSDYCVAYYYIKFVWVITK